MDAGVVWFALALTAIVALVALPRRAGILLQAAVIGLAAVVLVTFDGWVGAEYDAGGSPVLAIAKVTEARNRGDEVAIRGTCNSSCALRLAAGSSLCVSPQAEIGVHEVRPGSRPGGCERGVRANLLDCLFRGTLAGCRA